MHDARLPTLVILASATVASAAGVLLGGPRIGYLPGIVLSTLAALAILWRYDLTLRMRWLAATLLVAFHSGASLVVGKDVLAHVSIGNDAFRYHRGLHAFGATITVLLVAERARRRTMRVASVIAIAIAASLVVEGVELVNAVAVPRVFSYDLVDSSLDVVGNTAGFALGLVLLIWSQRRSVARYGPTRSTATTTAAIGR